MNNLKFNHDAESFHEALGTTVEKFATELSECVQRFADTENQTMSRLAEMLKNDLSPEHILILATREVHSTINRFNDDMLDKLIKMMEEKQN
jgi:hypothetical protein